jgi:hypothetical protein
MLQQEITRHVNMLCYIDCFRLLMWISLAISPLALLFAVKKKKLFGIERHGAYDRRLAMLDKPPCCHQAQCAAPATRRLS